MEITEDLSRLLQRSLNALGRGTANPLLRVDGRPGRKTKAALFRFLAAGGCGGEAKLLRAMRALGSSVRHNSPRTERVLCNLRRPE
ncbi:MAG TPA: hypothetical protein VEC11_01825 [Allosphingosinicella sp.]|nr:hypothetical protein [Allosphingosinicella sp.]